MKFLIFLIFLFIAISEISCAIDVAGVKKAIASIQSSSKGDKKVQANTWKNMSSIGTQDFSHIKNFDLKCYFADYANFDEKDKWEQMDCKIMLPLLKNASVPTSKIKSFQCIKMTGPLQSRICYPYIYGGSHYKLPAIDVGCHKGDNAEACVCESDLCNGSSQLMVPFGLTIFLVLAQYLC